MNSFVNRFSSTGPAAELRKAKEVFGDDEELSDVMWGSQAGFGTLAKGVPTFSVPAVADVRVPSDVAHHFVLSFVNCIALRLPETAYR